MGGPLEVRWFHMSMARSTQAQPDGTRWGARETNVIVIYNRSRLDLVNDPFSRAEELVFEMASASHLALENVGKQCSFGQTGTVAVDL
jgi:hypothetical protein